MYVSIRLAGGANRMYLSIYMLYTARAVDIIIPFKHPT